MSTEYHNKYLKYKNKYLKLKNNFNMKGGGGDADSKTLYLFKADWCGHCKAFKKTWEVLQSEVKDIKFVTFDADENKDEMKKFKIGGFPTLILNSNNKAIEYVGSRDIESIKDFIKAY